MDKTALKKLRKNLPKEAVNTLAAKFGLKPAYIGQILRGNRRNEAVIFAATDLLSEHLKQRKHAAEFIDSL